MKKFMAIAVVLMMVFTFGIATIHAQWTDTNNHDTMMMGNDCPMMAKADSIKCTTGNDGKCPMPSHHDSKTFTAHDHGAT